MIKEKFEKLFGQPEDILLSEEERGTITDFMVKFPEVWKIIKKYFYIKMNATSREMAKCKKEDLPKHQDHIHWSMSVLRDFQKIKEDYLRKEKKDNKLQKVKDFWYYVTSQDLRNESGKIKPGRVEGMEGR